MDQPLPTELTTDGHMSMLANAVFSGKTLRELAASNMEARGLDMIGSPETVAAKMDEAMADIGGDGFLINTLSIDRRFVAEICDGLIPALQRRGLTRTCYSHKMLRHNLLEF